MSTKYATIATSRGVIVAEIFTRDCPGVAEHFEQLANGGLYDGVRFHEIESGRTAHTGEWHSRSEPLGTTPRDTPQLTPRVPGEVVGNRNTHERGALSLEHDADGYGGSRFFFVLDSRVGDMLDGRHTVFGMVESGIEVLDRLEENDEVQSIRVWE